MRVGLKVAMGEALIAGRENEIAQWVGVNPLRWLDVLPGGYLGDCPAILPPASWCFDAVRQQLFYQPRHDRNLHLLDGSTGDGKKVLRWQVTRPVLATKNTGYWGVTVQLLTPYAVSYTHLDVYKRQLHPMMAGRLLVLALAALAAAPASALDFRAVDVQAAILYDTPSQKGKKLYIVHQYMPLEVVVKLDGWVKVRDAEGSLAWIERDVYKRQSQSNISQHLAILRDKGVLLTRKDANRVYYRVGDSRTLQLIGMMREVFCGVPRSN